MIKKNFLEWSLTNHILSIEPNMPLSLSSLRHLSSQTVPIIMPSELCSFCISGEPINHRMNFSCVIISNNSPTLSIIYMCKNAWGGLEHWASWDPRWWNIESSCSTWASPISLGHKLWIAAQSSGSMALAQLAYQLCCSS